MQLAQAAGVAVEELPATLPALRLVPAPRPAATRRATTFTLQQPAELTAPRAHQLAHPDSPVGRANARAGIRTGTGHATRPTDRPTVSGDVLAGDVAAALASFAAGARLGDREADLLPYLAKCLVAHGWVTP